MSGNLFEILLDYTITIDASFILTGDFDEMYVNAALTLVLFIPL